MKLSTKGEYGVLAMCELAARHGEGPISVKDIADKQGLSDAYLEQLFARLKKTHLIKSMRGAKGGYVLTRDPSDITVGEVIDALEGPIEISPCVGGANADFKCDKTAACATRGLWMEVHQSIRNVIDNRTLGDLVSAVSKEVTT
ncbi:MAG: Rrf2 family transcriptional regulator [Eubacteriaceae bacterium]|nr:Rrf2 family transcriptional regulator [Eubacteriaceae bacterium]MBR0383541.1 Rrf2 family transcriptional regulator [Eubacteriaceae bacterium]